MSWYQLLEIWKEHEGDQRLLPEHECPRDGTILITNEEGEFRCTSCGWPVE
jgi:uncharacterized Zn finger protein (UPF0148 family)